MLRSKDFWRDIPNVDSLINELTGLCKGLLADDQLTDDEITYLRCWLEKSRAFNETWPAAEIYRRIKNVTDDGVISADERSELVDILMKATGDINDIDDTPATRLPIDEPPPTIYFPNRNFCFTGTFYFGKRKVCEQAVIKRGGICEDNFTHRTNYLVIGLAATKAWVHPSFGRKIERANQYKAEGSMLWIVSEEHWVKFLSPIPL